MAPAKLSIKWLIIFYALYVFLKTHKKVVLVTNSNAYTVKKAQLWHCCNIQLQDNVPTYTTVPSKFIKGKQLRLFSSDMKVISILLYPTFFSTCDKVNWKEFCTPILQFWVSLKLLTLIVLAGWKNRLAYLPWLIFLRDISLVYT